VGSPKAESARAKIGLINPDVRVVVHAGRATSENIAGMIAPYDFIIDGTDNFPAKFLINDACVLGGKPFSHCGILRFHGQAMTYVPGHACYRCMFIEPPPEGAVPSCREAGILGVVAGIMGCVQAAEALRYIIGVGELLIDTLLVADIMKMDFRKITVRKNSRCPVCGDNPTVTGLRDYALPACDLRKS